MYTNQIPADPTAVMGKRIGAFLVNLVIYLVVVVVCARVFADFKSEDIPASLSLSGVDVCELIRSDNSISMCFSTDDTVIYATGANAGFWVYGVPAIFALLNSVVLAGLTGASIGKHIFGLRVVKQSTGALAGFGALLIRHLLWIVDGFFYCFPLVGLITGLSTKHHRRVGDMAAGTVVVAKASVGTPVMAGAQPAGWSPPPAPGGFGPPPVDPWTPAGPAAPVGDSWGAPSAPPAPGSDPWAAPSAPPASSAPVDPWAGSAPSAPAPDMDDWAAPQAPQNDNSRPPARDDATMVMPSGADPAGAPADAAPATSEPQSHAAPATSEPQSHAAPATSEPQWDAARNAYIQWEPVSGQWMQFDDAAQQWRPLT